MKKLYFPFLLTKEESPSLMISLTKLLEKFPRELLNKFDVNRLFIEDIVRISCPIVFRIAFTSV